MLVVRIECGVIRGHEVMNAMKRRIYMIMNERSLR